jgi:hypothetical protein
MKIPFKFQEIQNLDQTKYTTKFKSTIKKIKAKSNSPETAVEVFINQEHEFSDGSTGPFMLIGNLAGPWKKYAKDKIKANKKMTMVGKGYVTKDDSGNEIFTFMKLKGSAKINKFEKEAKKVLRAAKLKLNLVDNIVNGAPVDETQDSAEDSTAEEPTVNKDKELIPIIKNLMQTVATGFKEKIKKEVVPAIKGQTAKEEHLQETETLRDKIDELIEAADELSDAVRAKIDENLNKITGMIPSLDKIYDKLTNLIGIEEEEEEDDDIEEAMPENPNDSFINDILEMMSSKVDEYEGKLTDVEKSLQEMAKAAKDAIPSGDDLLKSLF